MMNFFKTIPNFINCTPHDVKIIDSKGIIRTFPKSNLPPIRCSQSYLENEYLINDIKIIKGGVYTLDKSSINASDYKNTDGIIVSTIVANCADEIRNHLSRPDIKILVPDSGPSAQRTKEGLIDYILKFIEY